MEATAKKHLTWDYKGFKNPFYGEQKDWNQTFITRINEATEKTRDKVKGGEYPLKLKVPAKFKSIFESLEFFKKETCMITNRHLIEFDENDTSNIIDVRGEKIEIINFENNNGNMEKLTKEHLITLFQNQIEKLEDSNMLIRLGTIDEPDHLLQISDTISISLQIHSRAPHEGPTYSIGLIFGGFVDYKIFEIQKHEYEYLVNVFDNTEYQFLLQKKKEIITEGERELKGFLQ